MSVIVHKAENGFIVVAKHKEQTKTAVLQTHLVVNEHELGSLIEKAWNWIAELEKKEAQ